MITGHLCVLLLTDLWVWFPGCILNTSDWQGNLKLIRLICAFLLALKKDFRQAPSDVVVALGEPAVFECVPPEGYPEPTVYWRHNGYRISTEEKGVSVSWLKGLAAQFYLVPRVLFVGFSNITHSIFKQHLRGILMMWCTEPLQCFYTTETFNYIIYCKQHFPH